MRQHIREDQICAGNDLLKGMPSHRDTTGQQFAAGHVLRAAGVAQKAGRVSLQFRERAMSRCSKVCTTDRSLNHLVGTNEQRRRDHKR
jgi:hypothetical protein